MEFMCNLLNIKLTEIFKVKFCTNYEKFIHTVPNFRKMSTSYNATYSHVHTHTHTHTHTDTHAHIYTHTLTREQHDICLRGNIFSNSCPGFLLAYEALVSRSRNFPHKQLKLYRYNNTTCCIVQCMTFIDVLYYVTFLHPHISVHPLLYLSPCSPDPSPHTPV